MMAFTEADKDKLRSAIAKGEKSVMFGDRSVTYRSVAEMVEALRFMDSEGATRSRTLVGVATKGL